MALIGKMEAIVEVRLSTAGVTNLGHETLQQGHRANRSGSLNRRVYPNCRHHWHREKFELDCRNASVRVAGGFQRDDRGHHVNAEPTRYAKGQWDGGGPNPKAELTRAEGSNYRSRNGVDSLKLADLGADQESQRATNYRGAHKNHRDIRGDSKLSQVRRLPSKPLDLLDRNKVAVNGERERPPFEKPISFSLLKAADRSPAQRSDSLEEDKKATTRSSASWVKVAGAECPLNTDEEQSLSDAVQDMLFLESQKKDLEKILGREPTVEEWGSHCGTSIFKLYARIGRGRAAKRKMIAANLPLVSSMAQQFRGRGLSHWELCQEGVQGLEKSTEKFNTAYNTKFSSYSFLWIWERMSAGVRKFRNVLRISRTVYEMASMLLRQEEVSEEEFQVLHGRSPSLQELAAVSHMDADKIRNVTRLVRPAKSMDEPVSSLEGDFRKQVEDQDLGCVPWTHIMESELKAEVANALQRLTSREQTVLEMRYGLGGEPPKGRAQVGLALDLTYESIRLIEKKALSKLRHSAEEDGLHEYLLGSVRAH